MITTLNELEYCLGYSLEDLQGIVESIDSHYYTYSKVKTDETGSAVYKNGQIQKRHFQPSKRKLKDIQKRIQKRILSKVQVVDSIKGGVKGESNIKNSDSHKGKKFHFQTDIQNFFPSVSNKMVFNTLRAKGFSKRVADILTKLITIDSEKAFREKCLPQGTPTSVTMANLVIEKVVKNIQEIIKGRGITFTVWVDDFSFSSSYPFSDLHQQIIETISSSGFKVSREKTFAKVGKTEITGAEVGNNYLNPTKKFKNKENNNLSIKQIKGRNQYKLQIRKINST